MKETVNKNTELIDFEVQVPNLEGDGIAEVRIIKVPARKSAGGEWILTTEALNLIEQTQSRYMGLMSPSEIKELRMQFQFTQRQMSELIQAGEKSYTRWENGRARLSRLVNIILCAIRDGLLPIPYLQTLYKHGCDWHKKVEAYEKIETEKSLSMRPPPMETGTLAHVASQNLSFGAGLGAVWRGNGHFRFRLCPA